MVSDNKEKLENLINEEETVTSEEDEIKLKLDAVMKARAKKLAMAKIEAEKKARDEVLGEKEKTLAEQLAAAERIKEARRAKELAEQEAAERVKRAEALKEAAIKEAAEKQQKREAERIEAEKAKERAVIEKQRRMEAEKKATDMRLKREAAKKASERMRDEKLAKLTAETMDAAAKAAAVRVLAAEAEKEAARKAEIAELERLINRLETEKNEEARAKEEAERQARQEVLVEKELAEAANAPEYEGNPTEAAYKYAKYLREHNLKPGDATFINPEDIGIVMLDEEATEPIEFSEDDLEGAIRNAEQRQKQIRQELEKKKWDKADEDRRLAEQAKLELEKKVEEEGLWQKIETVMAAPIFLHDKIQDTCDSFLEKLYLDAARGMYAIIRGYRHSQRQIGLTLLLICFVCGVVVTFLNRNTVYEYSYNGKVLGYVEDQDDVTNVLAIAGEKLNSINDAGSESIEFTAGDNITFSVVDSNGKDIDDADDTVNKLAYMTDIEVEAYGVYDGDKLVTIVKSTDAAEELLEEVKATLGKPDEGMEIVSVDFENPLSIKPVKVLLTSVQSNSAARKQMTDGGDVEFYHLVEINETMDSITATFGVTADEIYDEENEDVVSSINAGDKICIRKDVEAVSVKLVEKGKMKEIVPYETIKKDSKDYYKGDEVVDVEGIDGIQIFEGTVTKVGGKVTKRNTKNLEVIREKVDKVILVGTADRPKTAPTGVFKNPLLPGTYVVTSWMGARWGRQHEGIDMGASTGTPVYATDGGTVTFAGYSGGYGNLIIIEHYSGVESRYGHLSSIGVSVGQKVYQGQYIAAVGNTGRSTGSHLHFEIRENGTPVNPAAKVQGGV